MPGRQPARLVDAGLGRSYTERSKAIVAQYAAYEPLPGLHINGELTQGENIADNGGLKIAYAAFQKALAKHPEGAQEDRRLYSGSALLPRLGANLAGQHP